MKKLFCIQFLIFSFANASTKTQIVNGIPVTSENPIAKSTVHITGKYQRFSFTCTGTIIAQDLVITAAHCLGPYAAADLTVFFGLNKNSTGLTYKVKKQIFPDAYNATVEFDRHDIALLLLEKSIPSNYFPAEFLDSNIVLKENDILALAGYGINVTQMPANGNGGLGQLRYAEQNIINPKYGETEILINIKNKGTCSGDSGGPAYFVQNNKIYLVGAASRMTAKDIIPGSKPVQCACTEEIVYTNLIKEMSWIQAASALIRK